MNTFDDDEHKTKALPMWETLTAVSEALEIPRNAIKSAARRALKNQEPWVKKDHNIILIDVNHDMYRIHASRWQQQHGMAWIEEDVFGEDDLLQDEMLSPEHATPAYRWYPSLLLEGYTHWPEICQWLASQGLHISFNLLAGEQATSLQWHWGRLQGTIRHGTIKDAIIAALGAKFDELATLQAKLDWVMEQEDQSVASSSSSTQDDSVTKSLWHKLWQKGPQTSW